MKRRTKLRVLNSLNKWLRIKAIHFAFAVVIGVAIIYRDIILEAKPLNWNNYLDLTVVFSVVVTFIGSALVGRILGLLQTYLEDYLKLDCDYNRLLKLLGNNDQLISYRNPVTAFARIGRKSTSVIPISAESPNDFYRFPVTVEY